MQVSDWVRRYFFSLAVSGGNLLAGDVHSSATMDRLDQAWQWTGRISLLTWGLLCASACSVEACHDSPTFLPLTVKSKQFQTLHCSQNTEYYWLFLAWIGRTETEIYNMHSSQKMSVIVCILCILHCGFDVINSITLFFLLRKPFLLSYSVQSSSAIISRNPSKTLAEYFYNNCGILFISEEIWLLN